MNFGQWLGLVALVVSLVILWSIRQLLLLLFVAVVFATALNRLVRQWQKAGVKRGTAVAVSVIGVLAIIVLFAALIVPPFLDQFQQLTLLVPEGLQLLRQLINQLLSNVPGVAEEYVPDVNDLFNQLQPVASGVANNVLRLFSGVISISGSILFVFIFTIMLLINPQSYRHGFVQLFPAFYRRRTDQILTLCEVDLVSWIIGTLFNMLVIGIVSGIVLWALGVPLVLANALLAGLMEAIPNLGPFISTIAPATIALLDSPIKAVLVIAAYFLIQQLEQFLLVPIVMGQQVALLPAVTLLAQIVFASFFGFLGLFLAIPLIIIVRVLIREILIRDVLDQWKLSPVTVSVANVSDLESPSAISLPSEVASTSVSPAPVTSDLVSPAPVPPSPRTETSDSPSQLEDRNAE